MRRAACLSYLVLLGAACTGGQESFEGPGAEFLDSRELRRSVLEQSLVNPDNGYSQLRLLNYARSDGDGAVAWDALPIWNPPTRPVTMAELGGELETERAAIDLDIEWNDDEILALGKWAFQNWPLSDDAIVGPTLLDSTEIERMGIWVDGSGLVGGYVSYLDDEGQLVYAKTCSTCHARVDADGSLVLGASNVDFDLGRMQYEALLRAGTSSAAAEELAEWGRGHVDSTADSVDNPTGIPDLRPIRYQNHLNAAASVRNSLLGLAVRTETLMITSRRQQQRPPREIAFAVAYYLWSLGEETRVKPALTNEEELGRVVFQRECDGCHHEDGSTEAPIPMSQIGTDPATGISPMRGTGTYRIPSLWGVGDRRRLLHRGQVRSLEEHLSAERPLMTPGHLYGLELPEDERRELIAFLQTL